MKTACLAVILAMAGAPVRAGKSSAEQKSVVVVCMNPDPHALMGVRPLVSSMFARIGVPIDWHDLDSCPLGAGAIQVRLTNNSASLYDSKALAFSQPYQGTIVVFLDRVLKLNRCAGPSLLAHVLVHEIAHVLERIDRHSDGGIMKDRWDDNDYSEMCSHPLRFHPKDVTLILDGLKSNLTITVQVYNWASAAPRTLSAAENEAARIFREAGVPTSWLHCPLSISEAQDNRICIEPCPPNRFAVRIIREVPLDHPQTSLGVALSGGGTYATIFYRRVEDYTKLQIASDSQILGHAMAHEIGHLLLGPLTHTRFGIMRAQWTAEDLRDMTMGVLCFDPQQSAAIRQAATRQAHSRVD